jgi:GR25 family glycosyltransferase involved in LPS biosynthesis
MLKYILVSSIILFFIIFLYKQTEIKFIGKYDAYVITLDKLNNRQKFITKTMTYPFQFFYGVDGKKLSQYEKDKCCNNSKMSDSQIGIFSSHKALWEKLKNKTTPTLIMEDDSVIIDNIEKVILPNDFDIVYFGHCFESKGKQISKYVYKSINPICMHGYLISQKGIHKLLNFFNDPHIKIDKDFDNFYVDNLVKTNKLITYSIFPQMIKQNNRLPSTADRN